MSTNTIKFKGAVYAENTSIQVPSGTLYEVKELKSDSLEANSLSITVTSNDTSILKYKKNDKVEYFRDGKRKGIFYLQSVKRVGPNDYSLYGLSALGRLLQMKHVGGIYTGETVATVVQAICGSVPVIVETVYAKIALYGYLPYADGVTTSARDNLAQVLFAIGAWLGTDENGVLRVEKLWDGTASTIGANRISSQNCNVEYLDPISSVEVVEHGYIPDTKEVTLFDGTAQANDLVVFSEPIHDLSATGFTILESGTNYAILSAGTGTLTGKGYLHSTRVIQRPVSVGVEENVLFVDGATLVSLVNSAAVTDRLVNYYKHREQISGIVDVSQERVGHVVNLYHPWDRTLVSACLSEREVSISGILEANTKALVGFLPPQPEITEYYDERVLLTGSGEWESVIDGEIRVVVIGGGETGASGSAGSSAGISSQSKRGSSGSYSGSSAGQGGEGGEGGSGGKILIASLNVITGQKFQYAAAQPAGNSTFGELSSASGEASADGYYDLVTQTFFGRKGADGKKGGNGGSPGNDGQAVGDFRGGYGINSKTVSDTEYGISGTVTANGWGGGGAAQGANGATSAGEVYINLYGEFDSNDPSQSVVTLSGSCSGGGKGANGANGNDGENYGDGGDGGHGGGGAGAVGTLSMSFSPSGKNPKTETGGASATGGSAGAGGAGKPGCIIIYYRKKKELQSGWFKDKNGKLLLERLGKRFIV
jgi:hypothetical protein